MKAPNQNNDNPIKLLSLGALLSQSWALYRAYFATLVGYSAWLLLPYAAFLLLELLTPGTSLIALYSSMDTTIELSLGIQMAVLLIAAAQIIVMVWAANAIVKTVAKLYYHQKTEDADIASDSWKMVWPVMFVTALFLLIVVAGLFVLVIPGLLFMVWLAFAIPSVQLDGKKRFGALKYSTKLIKGRFWNMAARLTVGPLILLIGYLAVLMVTNGLALTIANAFIGDINEVIQKMMLVNDLISTVIEIVAFPLFLSYGTILYLNAKETLK